MLVSCNRVSVSCRVRRIDPGCRSAATSRWVVGLEFRPSAKAGKVKPHLIWPFWFLQQDRIQQQTSFYIAYTEVACILNRHATGRHCGILRFLSSGSETGLKLQDLHRPADRRHDRQRHWSKLPLLQRETSGCAPGPNLLPASTHSPPLLQFYFRVDIHYRKCSVFSLHNTPWISFAFHHRNACCDSRLMQDSC